jgi:hypothetical protein
MFHTLGGPLGRARGGLALAAIVTALGCAVLVGCAQQSPTTAGAPPPPPAVTSPAPATPSAEVCTAAAEFQSAANAIVPLDATEVGTDGVKAALQNLETTARGLAAAAQQQYGPQVDALNEALAALQTTISGLSDQNSLSAKLGALASSVAAVESAAKPIVDSLRAGCPSLPPAQLPPTS